jgi:hypothetical protein
LYQAHEPQAPSCSAGWFDSASLRSPRADSPTPPFFDFALASVRGTEHARLNRNNQDAAAAWRCGDAISVAVADGCSEGPSSEVGARLVARFVTRRACESRAWGSALAAEVTDALVAWLYGIARGAGELEPFIHEHLLTTFLCAVVRGPDALVFGVGDGVVQIDGVTRVLDAGPENAPPYVAYRMLPQLGADSFARVHHEGPARRVALATDGLKPRLALLERAFDWKNPLTLQRTLNVTRGLTDDTTVALLRAA